MDLFRGRKNTEGGRWAGSPPPTVEKSAFPRKYFDRRHEEPTVDALPTFEAYYAMSPAEQEAFYLSFSKPTDFFAWYNAAKDKYLEEHPGVELGPGGVIPTP